MHVFLPRQMNEQLLERHGFRLQTEPPRLRQLFARLLPVQDGPLRAPRRPGDDLPANKKTVFDRRLEFILFTAGIGKGARKIE